MMSISFHISQSSKLAWIRAQLYCGKSYKTVISEYSKGSSISGTREQICSGDAEIISGLDSYIYSLYAGNP